MAYVGEMSIKDIRFQFRTNFEGRPTPVNQQGGKRYFNIKLEDEALIQELESKGLTVKSWPKNPEPGEEVFRYLEVKVNYNGNRDRDPVIWQINAKNNKRTLLDEETVGMLDRMQDSFVTGHVKFNISSYPPTPMKPEGGCTAYCQKLLYFFEPDPIDAILDNLDSETDISDEPVPF